MTGGKKLYQLQPLHPGALPPRPRCDWVAYDFLSGARRANASFSGSGSLLPSGRMHGVDQLSSCWLSRSSSALWASILQLRHGCSRFLLCSPPLPPHPRCLSAARNDSSLNALDGLPQVRGSLHQQDPRDCGGSEGLLRGAAVDGVHDVVFLGELRVSSAGLPRPPSLVQHSDREAALVLFLRRLSSPCCRGRAELVGRGRASPRFTEGSIVVLSRPFSSVLGVLRDSGGVRRQGVWEAVCPGLA